MNPTCEERRKFIERVRNEVEHRRKLIEHSGKIIEETKRESQERELTRKVDAPAEQQDSMVIAATAVTREV